MLGRAGSGSELNSYVASLDRLTEEGGVGSAGDPRTEAAYVGLRHPTASP